MATYGNHGIEQHERDSRESTSDVKSYLTDYDVELEDLVEESGQGRESTVLREPVWWRLDGRFRRGHRLVC